MTIRNYANRETLNYIFIIMGNPVPSLLIKEGATTIETLYKNNIKGVE